MSEWVKVIESILADDAEAKVVLVGVPADRADADEVARGLGGNARVVDLVGRTSHLEALALLERCDVLLACDGGVVYMGAAMGCATVSLWGPGVMERFKPPGERHVGVRKDYPCIPCVTWDRLGEFPRCPYDRKCYGDLTAAEVFEAYGRAKRSASIRGETVRRG
jgi:ADP-heptose:LPS heptosyltransferase